MKMLSKFFAGTGKKLHGGVCHCFNGGADIARIYTEEFGLSLGIGGALLMKPEYRKKLEEAVIAERIAELKGVAVDDVSRITEENTRRIFRLTL